MPPAYRADVAGAPFGIVGFEWSHVGHPRLSMRRMAGARAEGFERKLEEPLKIA
jgi:hypothetical protein